MNDQTDHSEVDNGSNGLAELKLLKQRATMMGIPFSNNIGLEALRAKVAAKMEGPGEIPQDEPEEEAPTEETPNPFLDPEEQAIEDARPKAQGAQGAQGTLPRAQRLQGVTQRKHAFRAALLKKQMKLVRLRIQNLDPKKKDLHGEVLTVANEVMGVVSKFIPYGEVTDEGYHVPYCLYRQLEARKFVNITVTRDRRTGKEVVKTNMAKEFSIEVLPQLTKVELQRLGAAQAAAGSISND